MILQTSNMLKTYRKMTLQTSNMLTTHRKMTLLKSNILKRHGKMTFRTSNMLKTRRKMTLLYNTSKESCLGSSPRIIWSVGRSFSQSVSQLVSLRKLAYRVYPRIVSCRLRFFCAWSGCRVEFGLTFLSYPFPFSFFAAGAFPFSLSDFLWIVVSSGEFRCIPVSLLWVSQ